MEVIAKYAKTALPPRIRHSPAKQQPDAARQSQTRIHAARRRLSPERIGKLAADYRDGRSTTWLMRNYGLGKGTVLNLLEEQGVAKRGQGIPENRLYEAIQLYESGLSLMNVAHHMGCSAETVRQALLAAGISMRAQWERGKT